MFIAYLAAAAVTVPQATAIDPASWFSPNDYPTLSSSFWTFALKAVSSGASATTLA